MQVSIKGVTKNFGATAALRGIDLEIADHELFFLLGPSGCGKTTLLRLLAGFYQPDAGEIRFGEKRMNGVPPHLRNTGMVFQNYALWPHLSVAENVGYGLDVRRMEPEKKKNLTEEALEVVRMTPYASRTPNQLSGGQQQRVALARALVIRPDVLLLDEPLSNLDAKLRLEMRDEIRRIHDETKITTVYVTHDQKEALSLADRIAVFREGQVEQLGEPRSIYRGPVNRFVADFIGETNWLEGEVIESGSSGMVLQTGLGRWQAEAPGSWQRGQRVMIGFRPEAVGIGPGPANVFSATIRHLSYLGEIEQYQLEAGQIQFKAFEQNPLERRTRGQSLEVHILPRDLIVQTPNSQTGS